jgi:hypothetical protein
MAREPVKLIATFVMALLVVDAAVLLPLGVFGRGGQARAVTPATPSPPGPVGPSAPAADAAEREPPWALCQDYSDGVPVTPTFVAITYLDHGLDEDVTPDDVRVWIADLPPRDIAVVKLTDKAGRRRVALELRSTWPEWSTIVGNATGRAACERLQAALDARGVGRPEPAPLGEEKSRYRFEILHGRRDAIYRSREEVGPLDRLLSPRRLRALLDWLAESE